MGVAEGIFTSPIDGFYSLRSNMGLIPGVIPISILSSRVDLGLVEETLWPVSTQARYAVKDIEGALSVVSSSSLDSYPAGTGIQTVKIGIIKGDYSAESRIVRLDGITPVTQDEDGVPLVGLAINQMNPEIAGTTKTAQGNIDVLYGTDVLSRIAALVVTGTGTAAVTYNISRQQVFTVPAGLTLWLYAWSCDLGAADSIDVKLYVRNPLNGICVLQHDLYGNNNQVSAPLGSSWIKVPEKHFLEVTGKASKAGDNKIISCAVMGMLIVDSIVNPQ